jgi:hypothetical protein
MPIICVEFRSANSKQSVQIQNLFENHFNLSVPVLKIMKYDVWDFTTKHFTAVVKLQYASEFDTVFN